MRSGHAKPTTSSRGAKATKQSIASLCSGWRSRLRPPTTFSDMRAETNLSNRIKLIWAVQSCLKKYFPSRLRQITSISFASRPFGGAFRDRHERWAGDAMDADALLTRCAEADGEVVW